MGAPWSTGVLIQKCLYTHCIHSHMHSLTYACAHFIHTLTLFTPLPKNTTRMHRRRGIQSWYQLGTLKWVRPGWWHIIPKGMSGLRGTVRSTNSERKVGNCQSSPSSLCPFATQPEGGMPGSALCTRKLHLLSGNRVHLRKGWSSCWQCKRFWGSWSKNLYEKEKPQFERS